MMISTRGRYALRFMIDLAQHHDEGYVALKAIAARQEFSLKYLERIVPALVKAGAVQAVHGKGGGYKLAKDPEDYSVGDILRASEGDLAPVACLALNAKACHRASFCKTLPLWQDFYNVTNEYFDGIRLSDLV